MQVLIDQLRDDLLRAVDLAINPGPFPRDVLDLSPYPSCVEQEQIEDWVNAVLPIWTKWALSCERVWTRIDTAFRNTRIAAAYEIAATENREPPVVRWSSSYNGSPLSESFPNYSSILCTLIRAGSTAVTKFHDVSDAITDPDRETDSDSVSRWFEIYEWEYRCWQERVNQDWLRNGLLFEIGRLRLHTKSEPTTSESQEGPSKKHTFGELLEQVQSADAESSLARDCELKANDETKRDLAEYHRVRGASYSMMARERREEYATWEGVDRIQIELEAEGERMTGAALVKWRAFCCKSRRIGTPDFDAMMLQELAAQLDTQEGSTKNLNEPKLSLIERLLDDLVRYAQDHPNYRGTLDRTGGDDDVFSLRYYPPNETEAYLQDVPTGERDAIRAARSEQNEGVRAVDSIAARVIRLLEPYKVQLPKGTTPSASVMAWAVSDRLVSPCGKYRRGGVTSAYRPFEAIREKLLETVELHSWDIASTEPIDRLGAVAVGAAEADDYHKLIAEILQKLFTNELSGMKIEQRINDGRKRVDICFDNVATEGFFYDLKADFQVMCPVVFVECKNYSEDPTNPELDQLLGRFGAQRGRFGLLLCRKIVDRKTLLARCKDAVHSGQGFLIAFDDEDVCAMWKLKLERKLDEVRGFLRGKMNELIL